MSEDLQILRRHELADLLGVSVMSIYRWEQSGPLPRRIRVGPNIVGWRRADIQAFLDRAAEGPRP